MEKLCECGCGQAAPIATVTSVKFGRVKGEPCRFVLGHYARFAPRKPLAERFWSYVDKNGPIPPHCPELGACWLWKGTISKEEGRATIKIGTARKMAAHVSWFLHTGAWPVLHVCHKCDNPSCCRFEHLFEGTQSDNMRDASAKSRTTCGERSGMAKLTDDKVREIRRKAAIQKTPNRQIAKEYGLDPMTIKAVVSRKTWRHIQ